MNKILKLEDITGVKSYLENDCYCRYEIYSTDGFFYQLFKPDEECKLLGTKENYYHVVIAKDQLLIFYTNDGIKVLDSIRYDATKNNIEICLDLIKGVTPEELKKQNRLLDQFDNNDSDRSLKDILSMCDAIMITK